MVFTPSMGIRGAGEPKMLKPQAPGLSDTATVIVMLHRAAKNCWFAG